MHVLLTRPMADSQEAAGILNARNITTSLQPLFEIDAINFATPDLSRYGALIATSRHSIRIFAAQSDARNLPIFCVGDQTAEAAAQKGFHDIHSADGDAAQLFSLIRKMMLPSQGKLLRLAGLYEEDPLEAGLKQAGYEVDRLPVYETRETQEFSRQTITLLIENTLEGVVFFSPKTASRFYNLAAKQGLSAPCRQLTAWCISDRTAKALAGLDFKQILIAAKPTKDELLRLIAK